MDATIVNKRLLSRETVLPVSEPSVKRVASRLLAFQSEPQDDSLSAYNDLLKELSRYEFEATKADQVYENCRKEIDYYQQLNTETESSIADLSLEIQTLKQRLDAERLRRLQKEESESLAKVVNELPTRASTSAELASVDEELAKLTSLQNTATNQLELRQKQFQLLMHSIYELQQALSEDADKDSTSEDAMEED